MLIDILKHAAVLTYVMARWLAVFACSLACELVKFLYAIMHPRMLFLSVWAQPLGTRLFLLAVLSLSAATCFFELLTFTG